MGVVAWRRWLDRLLTLASVGVIATVGYRYLGPRPGDALEALSGASVAPPGKVALIEIGATYCPACIAMTPTVELLRRAYATRAEVRVLQIDRPEHRAALEPLARLAKVRYTPTFLVVGRNGQASAKFIGPSSYVALSRALDEALREGPR
ncbi:MAG TPA: thioredoxin family protein [Stenomitos sp.]